MIITDVVRGKLMNLHGAVTTLLAESIASRRDRGIRQLTPSLERVIGRSFRLQGREFLKELNKRYRGVWIGLMGESQATLPGWELAFAAAMNKTKGAFAVPIIESIKIMLRLGAESEARDLGLQGSFDVYDPQTAIFMQQYGAQRVSQLNATTKEQMRSILSQGADEGWGYNKLAREITASFQEMAVGKPQLHIASRAHFIAVTELGEAYSFGQYTTTEAIQSRGLEMEKAWLTVGDDRVSDDCLADQAAGWIPLKQAFPGGKQRPLQHPGCRCTALYRRVGAEEIKLPGKPSLEELTDLMVQQRKDKGG